MPIVVRLLWRDKMRREYFDLYFIYINLNSVKGLSSRTTSDKTRHQTSRRNYGRPTKPLNLDWESTNWVLSNEQRKGQTNKWWCVHFRLIDSPSEFTFKSTNLGLSGQPWTRGKRQIQIATVSSRNWTGASGMRDVLASCCPARPSFVHSMA